MLMPFFEFTIWFHDDIALLKFELDSSLLMIISCNYPSCKYVVCSLFTSQMIGIWQVPILLLSFPCLYGLSYVFLLSFFLFFAKAYTGHSPWIFWSHLQGYLVDQSPIPLWTHWNAPKYVSKTCNISTYRIAM